MIATVMRSRAAQHAWPARVLDRSWQQRDGVLFCARGRADEGGEERVRLQRLGFEFWMELTAEKQGGPGLNDLDVILIRRPPSDAQAAATSVFS